MANHKSVSYTHLDVYKRQMPGRVIQSLKKAKSNNPLFLLDEIDKMGADFRGDPASALLEVLDPEPVSYTHLDVYKRQVLKKCPMAAVSNLFTWSSSVM